MNTKLSISVLLVIASGLAACSDNDSPKGGTRPFDAALMHESSQEMLGVRGKSKDSNKLATGATADEGTQSSSPSVKPLIVNLGKFKEISSAKFIEKLLPFSKDEKYRANEKVGATTIGRKYLTEYDAPESQGGKEVCAVIYDSKVVVVRAEDGDYREVEAEKTISRITGDLANCNTERFDRPVLTKYNSFKKNEALDPQEMMEFLKGKRTFQVDANTFAVHDNELSIVVSFLANGRIHLDGIVWKNNKVAGVISVIPQADTDLSVFDGVEMDISVEKPCDKGYEAGSICFESHGAVETFNINDYLQVDVTTAAN